MREIRAPTLLINGARSSAFFHAIADAMLQHLGDARRVLIEGAGHTMNAEQPNAFNAAVLEFLAATIGEARFTVTGKPRGTAKERSPG
jgi:pimeloyl-ACP methyl ester carboxylesterase